MESVIFDIFLIVLLLLFSVAGAKKGFVKPVIVFVVNMICIVAAFVFSGMTAGSVYENYFQDTVVSKTEDALSEFDVAGEVRKYYEELTIGFEMTEKQLDAVLSDEENMDKKLADIVKNETGVTVSKEEISKGLYNIINEKLQEKLAVELPPCAGKYFENLGNKKNTDIFELINILDTDEKAAAEYIEKNFAGKIVTNFIRIVMIVLMSIILTVVVQLVLNAVIFKNEALKAAGKADMAGGFVLGLVKGLVFCAIAAVMLKMFIYSGVSGKIINEENIQSSAVFKYFYNIDEIVKNK